MCAHSKRRRSWGLFAELVFVCTVCTAQRVWQYTRYIVIPFGTASRACIASYLRKPLWQVCPLSLVTTIIMIRGSPRSFWTQMWTPGSCRLSPAGTKSTLLKMLSSTPQICLHQSYAQIPTLCDRMKGDRRRSEGMMNRMG